MRCHGFSCDVFESCAFFLVGTANLIFDLLRRLKEDTNLRPGSPPLNGREEHRSVDILPIIALIASTIRLRVKGNP